MPSLAVRLEDEQRRLFRRLLFFSAAAHAAFALLVLTLPQGRMDVMLPGVVTVDLVGLPGPGGAPAPKPAAAPPQPIPEPAPAPKPPPPPVAKKVVLPEQPQKPPEEAPPKPAPPKPKPAPKPEPPAASKPEPAELDDVLASLREEAGEERPAPVQEARAEAVAEAGGGGGRGVPVSPEVAAWLREARNHVRRAWVLPAGFRTQVLETHVEVELDAVGKVQGEPRVTRRSGNPWYDESVVRAIEKASPLPAPPRPGRWPFVFRPEDY